MGVEVDGVEVGIVVVKGLEFRADEGSTSVDGEEVEPQGVVGVERVVLGGGGDSDDVVDAAGVGCRSCRRWR